METQDPGEPGENPEWRGRVGELEAEALGALWVEAVRHARWEIGRYARWRRQNEPVLAGGYDAEGIVQAAFQRLMEREAENAPLSYSVEDVRHELRMLIKHRVRWLHERSETRLVVGEWDLLPPKADGELVSVFKYLPGRLKAPDEELMQKEKEEIFERFKVEFEKVLRENGKMASSPLPSPPAEEREKVFRMRREKKTKRQTRIASKSKNEELLEVFQKLWEGKKRREIAKELGMDSRRVKTLRAQVSRRLAKFGAEAGEEVVKVLIE